MLYIKRNQAGEIIALTRDGGEKGAEMASLLDNEVVSFLHQSGEIDEVSELLSLSDSSMARVIEDLIDLLIAKNIILFTELPEQARKKIELRRRARQNLSSDNIMVDDIL